MVEPFDPPFALGETVYVPWADAYTQKCVPCPICVGKRSVVLVLGSGEHVSVECQGCAAGYEGPRGIVMVREPTSGVREGTVTGLSLAGDRWDVLVGGLVERLIFRRAEAAEAVRADLHAEAEAQAKRSFEQQFKDGRRKHGWTARYHRDCICDLERKLAWHRAKLSEAKPVKAEP